MAKYDYKVMKKSDEWEDFINAVFADEYKKLYAEGDVETVYSIYNNGLGAGETLRRTNAHILTPKIESIFANKEKGIIVIKWATGETTKVTCDEEDIWDVEKGIAIAISKYVLGNNYNAGNILQKYIKSIKYAETKKTKEVKELVDATIRSASALTNEIKEEE